MSKTAFPCPERRRLFVEFKIANQLLVQIHETEIDALLADDLPTFDGLQPQLAKARESRDRVAENLQRHIRDHGC